MQNQYVTKTTTNNSVYYQINHPKFSATIAEFGGQLLRFIPTGKADILWLSDNAILDGSKPIRGGVPLCWPWFGPAKGENAGKAQHGYIRAVPWTLNSVTENDNGVELILSPNLPSELEKELGLGVQARYLLTDEIEIELVTTNTSNESKALSQAIHTYFNVENINDCYVEGLDSVEYIDQLQQTEQNFTQHGNLNIDKHIDRIYLTAQDKVQLASSTPIEITGAGHDSVVIWNPWQDNAKSMVDFEDEGYQNMLCIEMANTQSLELLPKASHTLSQIIRLKS